MILGDVLLIDNIALSTRQMDERRKRWLQRSSVTIGVPFCVSTTRTPYGVPIFSSRLRIAMIDLGVQSLLLTDFEPLAAA